MSYPTPHTPGLTNNNNEKPVLRRKRSSFSDIFKILVIGDDKVGKTALIVRFLTRKFIGEYENNLEIKYRHSELVNNDQVLIEVCDSSKKNTIDNDDNIKWADGFIILYDITNYSSFEMASEFKIRLIDVKKSAQIPVILVGNKIDIEHRRAVNKSEVEHFATENSFLSMEISVASGSDQVREIFRMVCKEIQSSKRRSRTFLNRVLGGISSHKKYLE